MQLNIPTHTAETTTTDEGGVELVKYGVSTSAAMQFIIRDRMYSFPVRTAVQEYMSNARDANHEAERWNVPVEVHLPDSLNKELRIIDNGIGITPDRMRNVFVQFGESTKRTDSGQTGGFGIGSKIGFAVGDSFVISTVWEEPDSTRRKAIYSHFIDTDQKNTYAKLSDQEVVSTTPTGTTIHLPINDSESHRIVEYVIRCCRFWNTRPVVYPEVTWPIEGCSYSGDGWYLADGLKPGDPWNKALLIVDGIPYTINAAAFDEAPAPIKALIAKPVRIFAKNGEVAVAATREDLDYKPRSVENLIDLLAPMVESILARLASALNYADTASFADIFNLVKAGSGLEDDGNSEDEGKVAGAANRITVPIKSGAHVLRVYHWDVRDGGSVQRQRFSYYNRDIDIQSTDTMLVADVKADITGRVKEMARVTNLGSGSRIMVLVPEPEYDVDDAVAGIKIPLAFFKKLSVWAPPKKPRIKAKAKLVKSWRSTDSFRGLANPDKDILLNGKVAVIFHSVDGTFFDGATLRPLTWQFMEAYGKPLVVVPWSGSKKVDFSQSVSIFDAIEKRWNRYARRAAPTGVFYQRSSMDNDDKLFSAIEIVFGTGVTNWYAARFGNKSIDHWMISRAKVLGKKASVRTLKLDVDEQVFKSIPILELLSSHRRVSDEAKNHLRRLVRRNLAYILKRNIPKLKKQQSLLATFSAERGERSKPKKKA